MTDSGPYTNISKTYPFLAPVADILAGDTDYMVFADLVNDAAFVIVDLDFAYVVSRDDVRDDDHEGWAVTLPTGETVSAIIADNGDVHISGNARLSYYPDIDVYVVRLNA